MSDIVQEEVAIKNVGNPMELHLKTKYKVKAVGKEQVIDSTVLVHMTDASDGAKITKVEDKWGGTPPPDGFFSKVRFDTLLCAQQEHMPVCYCVPDC